MDLIEYVYLRNHSTQVIMHVYLKIVLTLKFKTQQFSLPVITIKTNDSRRVLQPKSFKSHYLDRPRFTGARFGNSAKPGKLDPPVPL